MIFFHTKDRTWASVCLEESGREITSIVPCYPCRGGCRDGDLIAFNHQSKSTEKCVIVWSDEGHPGQAYRFTGDAFVPASKEDLELDYLRNGVVAWTGSKHAEQ